MSEGSSRIVATYSIAACDLAAGQWGVATQSKFLAVGAIVPWAAPEVGAIATQAHANPHYGPEGLRLLADGLNAEAVVAHLTGGDEDRDHRQLGIVDGDGGSATFTGSACLDWAGGISRPGFAAQGNILQSAETVDALAETFERSAGRPLAERLLACLSAAQAAGGDRRGQQSAALLVVERNAGYGGRSDSLVDLRVDDHPTPIEELTRLYRIHQSLFGKTPAEEWLAVDDAIAEELQDRLGRLGYEGELAVAFGEWAATANLEERVDGIDRIDPVVLKKLRAREAAHAMSGWEAVHVDDLDAIPVAEGLVWRPVRRRLGIRAFGVNAYTSEAAGKHVVEEHDETGGGAGGHEELYVVMRGRATFTVDGETIDAPSGTLVFIREPALKRVAIAEEDGTLVLAVGGEPGQAYEVAPWESYFAAIPAFKAERWDEAIELIEAGLVERPGHPSILYNLACAESRAGKTAEALAHLEEAVRGNPKFAADARADRDFDTIRGDPGFVRLVAPPLE